MEPPAHPNPLLTMVSRGLDMAVLARLTTVAVEKPARLDLTPVAPEPFWRDSRVHRPRDVWIAAEWSPFEGHDWRELDLVGESEGPGDHAGSHRLIATAHIRRTRATLPVVLLVHGFAIPFTGFDRWLAWRMRRRGAHTIRMDLPFHLRRSVPGRESGDGFFSIDPPYTRAVIRQAVEDAAALVAWARREVSPVISIVGTSLGGLVATLLAAQVEVDGMIGVAPLADPAVSFLRRPPGALQRHIGMLGDGDGHWGRERASALNRLEGALAPLKPANLRPVTPGSRMTLVRPANDLIVGPEPIDELASAWNPEVWHYQQGHITVMNAPGLGRRLVERAVDLRGGAQRLRLAG